jgi:Domain of unknown function DUF29
LNKLYDHDFFAWTQDQADALRRRSANELDWENLLDEVEDLGRSQRRELRSRLIVLLAHILKWENQPEQRSRSWMATIHVQQDELQQLLIDSPSLGAAIERTWAQVCEKARTMAAIETGLPAEQLGDLSDITLDSALAYRVEPPTA